MRTLVWLLTLTLQDNSKLPLPDAEALKRAEVLVREIFKDDYAKKDVASRRAFARSLFKQGQEAGEDSASRYVLYREAADVAAEAGDLKFALATLDQGLSLFAVNGREARKNALSKARKTTLSPEDATTAYDTYLRIASEEADVEDFDAAAAALKEAEGLAEKLKNIALVSRARARSKDLGDLKKDAAGIIAARKTLTSKPDDPESNLMVGRHACFRKGAWSEGLPMLVKGADVALKSLAAKDLQNPSTASDQVAVGDGWWELSEKDATSGKEELRRRAAFWYQRAAPHLTGLTKAKVEKRLGSVVSRPVEGIDLMALIDLRQDTLKGDWRLVDRELHAPPTGQGLIQIPYVPPEEYDLRLVVRISKTAEVNLGVAIGDLLFVVAVDGWGGKFSGVELIDGKSFDVNETSKPGRFLKIDVPNNILCSVRKDRLRLEVNSATLVDWPLDRKRLALTDFWKRPRNGTLAIGSWMPYSMSRFELIPVSGQGKPIR